MEHNMLVRVVWRSFAKVLFAIGVLAILGALLFAYASIVEPHWLKVRHLRLSNTPTVKIIHFSDVHFKGDKTYLTKVVRTINAIDADFICFTGDIVEDAKYLSGALDILARVNKPMYGIPGNHDYCALKSFEEIKRTFQKNGGEWLARGSALSPSNKVELVAQINGHLQPSKERFAGSRSILLLHDPEMVHGIHSEHYDLVLAGHTHGGQVRFPFTGQSFLFHDIGEYDRGLFQTQAGPLYVNPGIGTYYRNIRFLCRPEITVIEF
jgi:predicted MPP superfamily phosphohydrolase